VFQPTPADYLPVDSGRRPVNEAADVLDRLSVRDSAAPPIAGQARRQLIFELISGVSGLMLAMFMWGHMFFVGSILLGTRGFDWIAESMEIVYIAQPTVIAILILFLVHAAFAARKIPAQLKERRRFYQLARELRSSSKEWRADKTIMPAHVESWLWIWQVRSGMVLLVLGSFHLVLMMLDIFTPLFGDRVGIEAITSMARTQSGLVWMYAVMLLCVEFHAGVLIHLWRFSWSIEP
jgi:fumarate reductase subunit C